MKTFLRAAIAVLAIAAPTFAQAGNDLVGTWKMDASRSKIAGSSGASALFIIKYERVGDLLRETLSASNTEGSGKNTIDYPIDGRELANGTGDDRVMAKLVNREGALILQWRDDGGTFTRTLTISADRRTLTIVAHDSNPDTKGDDVLVLQRQP
ncbi:MAG TPA: hypothetical protein VE961_04565 [Pyrinomonadaceae bacterium]|nr:hypothetical protein [Pyrinomonadaceae bacterium]